MSRAPIQVNSETKARLDKEKERSYKFRSVSDVIEDLLDYRERNEREREQERAIQKARMIDLGEEIKETFTRFREAWGLSEAAAVEFLLAHWFNSDKLDKSTFELYGKLRR